MGPAQRLVLESRGQQPCKPFVHLLGEDRIGMHWQPDILPIAPDMVGQPDGHCWGTLAAPLAQALVRHHKVVEADQQPDASAMTGGTPRQTAGAATQGRHEPTQGAIPAFHKGGLDRLSELTQTQLLAKTAWAPEDHAPADLHDLGGLVPHFHHLCVEQVVRGNQARFGVAPHFPTTPAPLHHPYHLEQRRGVGLPAVRQEEGQCPHAGDHLSDKRGRYLLRARAEIDPQEEPTAHR